MALQTPPDKRAAVHGSTAIDDDVLYEILLRLPAKALCRLRSVCRSWRSLLSAPSFVTAHTARRAAPLLLVHVHDASALTNVHVLDISSGEVVKRIRAETRSSATRPLNSLALMRTPDDLPLVLLTSTIDDGLQLHVLDPVTGVDFALPDVDHDKEQRHHASFMFGRASTGDYKVLCISTCTSVPNRQQLCKVLTLSGNHRWRETGCPPAKVRTCPRDGAAVNGVAYFLMSTTYDDPAPAGSKGCIMAYDLEKELWRLTSLPVPLPSNSNKQEPDRMLYHSLAELGGCLGLLYEDWDEFMELWLLVDPGKVIWSKRCTITVPYRYKGVQDPRLQTYFAEMLWLLDDGRIVIWMLLAGSGVPAAVLCTYDPRTMSYTDVADMPAYNMGGVYTGSLLGRDSREFPPSPPVKFSVILPLAPIISSGFQQ